MTHRNPTRPHRRRRFTPTAMDGGLRLEARALLATVGVTTTADIFDVPANVTVATLGNGGTDGRISLREAVAAVTNTGGANTVSLPAGTYNLANPSVEMILGSISGQNITVQGAGPGSTTINQTSLNTRIFNIDAANTQAGNISVTLQGLTIQGASNVNRQFGGGAVLGGGAGNSLRVDNCVFQNNSTSNGSLNIARSGGAISFSGGGNLTITNSRFLNNTAGGNSSSGSSGGAVLFNNATTAGVLTITNSTFSNNTAGGTGPGARGGAVFANGIGGFSIADSTFSNNRAGTNNSLGGGLYYEGTSSTASALTVTNSAFTGNTATTGGGLYLDNGNVTVSASQILNNTATSGGRGGGAYFESSTLATNTLGITSSTFTGNTAPTGGGLFTLSGAATLSGNRFFNNTATTSGEALANGGATVNANDNWWGADALPNAAGTDTVVTTAGTTTLSSRLALALTASPATVGLNGSSTLTASIVSTAASTTPVKDTALDGLTFTFAPGTLGSVSPTSVVINDGVATATFQAGSTAGTTNPSVTLDNGVKTTTVSIVAPPTANPQTVSTSFNTAVRVTLTGSDPNTPPRSLNYAIVSVPTNGTLSGSAPNLTYTPRAGFQGTDTFTFTVNNGFATSSTATVTIRVAPGTPTANPQTVAVAHNSAGTAINLTGSDPDVPPLPLTYTVVNGPTKGTLTGTGANRTYIPNPGTYGTDTFTFTVSNGTNTSAPAMVTLNVAVGTPVAIPQSVSTNRNTPVAVTLTGTDDSTPPLPLTYTITTPPQFGTLSGTAPNLTYTPNSNDTGSDSFAFTVSNGTNTSTPATVSINVNQVVSNVSGSIGVGWGTAGSATLGTASDGLRLLAPNRTNSNPWSGINRLTITLDRAAPLAAADVAVTGLTVANYGPVTVSGSGTTYTITLARPISEADRVTVTIGNATIGTFTRRLDVLPGDVNDDGAVTMQDATLIRNMYLGINGAVPTVFGDINGDGVVDVNDYNAARRRIGVVLP